MSSYLCGDDVLLGGFWSKVKKVATISPVWQAVKFVAHPVKQTKAAIKTVARFDPTSKTAKYSNVTKGALAIGAAVGATILTAGAAGPGAFALVGAAIPGAGKMITPVRKPPKTIAPDPGATGNSSSNTGALPQNSFTDTASTGRPADNSVIDQYNTSSTKKPMIGLGMAVVAAAVTIYALTRKKTSQGALS